MLWAKRVLKESCVRARSGWGSAWTVKKRLTLRPMSIVPFFKNAPLSRQFLHKLEVFCWKILVKAKKSAVPFLSNCCLKIFFELFLGFSMYLMFKIKIFKMQLLKNYTANPVNSTWSSSIVSSFFRKNCPIRLATYSIFMAQLLLAYKNQITTL